MSSIQSTGFFRLKTARTFMLLSALLSTAFVAALPVQAQSIGPGSGSYSAGAVNWHLNQQMFWQRHAPYMFRPTLPGDDKVEIDKDEPVVLFSSPGVQGKVVSPDAIPKVPEPDQIHIK